LFVDNAQRFSISHAVSGQRYLSRVDLENGSGDFEQPGRAHAAANAHGYDDVFDLRRLPSISACPTVAASWY